MWFIKVDDELTLENVCDITNTEPKALFNPLHEGVLNIILRDVNDHSKLTNNMIYTNITMPLDDVELKKKNGVPFGEIDKDITGISLYIDEDNYALADQIMNSFDEMDARAMMAKL